MSMKYALYMTTKRTLNKHSTNLLQLSIKFTVENELHEVINFLDLSIHRKDKKADIFNVQETTQTDKYPIALAIHINITIRYYVLNRFYTHIQ
jgi:hypothetical protein